MKTVRKYGWIAIFMSLPVGLLARPVKSNSPANKNIAWNRALALKGDSIYNALDLQQEGLSKRAFQFAWKGYCILLNRRQLENPDVLTICDFSQSSKNKRMYIIDLQQGMLLLRTYVAHGRNSGKEYANRFSNRPESHQSSLGFYVTKTTYVGEHGLSLRIAGMEPGFNDRALKRNIVVHGAHYAAEDFMENNKVCGRSYGCPAVPDIESEEVIDAIKNGSCLFIYHPTQKYIKGSRILNSKTS
ncbi:MAG TPA: murein L,D-transpeptidase catalytic domain family protein [Flavihumibacter sp.]|nr:murein L,D-transpeptidase catalytic domain family protein [Flavihumibacter sp.]